MLKRGRDKRKNAPSIEKLEDRRYMSWSVFPNMLEQDVAAQKYPELTGAGMSIAVIDSGIDYNHPLLGGGFGPGHKVVAGWDYEDGDPDPFCSTFEHGTGVAGILAGDGFTLSGQYNRGVAYGANLIALRQNSSYDVKQALDWVIAHRVEYNIVAVNITDFLEKIFDPSAYATELATLKGKGVFIAAPVGNMGVGAEIYYPAADPNCFGIGGINQSGNLTDETERGPALDLLAPSENVTTTYYDIATDRHYTTAYVDGTSFATPWVTGTAVLLKQDDPSLTPDQIMQIMKDSGVSTYDPATGETYKRLDIAAAIDLERSRRFHPGAGGTFNAIAYDAKGNLHMAYYETTTKELLYSVRNTSNVWSKATVIDSSPGSGQYVSLAIDGSGQPSVAYYDSTYKNLKFAAYTGGYWKRTVVESAGSVGLYPSLAYDSLKRAGISYYDATDGDLHVATLAGGAWKIQTVDSAGDTGLYSSLALNPATGGFATAWFNKTDARIRYATQSAGTWKTTAVTRTNGGAQYLSLAFDTQKRPAFSYYDVASGMLKFAHSAGSAWAMSTPGGTPLEGLYSHLYFDAAGDANVLYYNKTMGKVFAATGDVGNWAYSELLSGGGSYLSMARDAKGKVTFCSTVGGNLLVQDM